MTAGTRSFNNLSIPPEISVGPDGTPVILVAADLSTSVVRLVVFLSNSAYCGRYLLDSSCVKTANFCVESAASTMLLVNRSCVFTCFSCAVILLSTASFEYNPDAVASLIILAYSPTPDAPILYA